MPPGPPATLATDTPGDHPPGGRDVLVQGRVFAKGDDLDFSFISSGGPGGQNVNKRATKCVLRVPIHALLLTPPQAHRLRDLAGSLLTSADDLIIASDEHKSQERNRAECLERLANLIRRALVAPKVRRATKPSRGSKERRIAAKKIRSEAKKRRGEHHD